MEQYSQEMAKMKEQMKLQLTAWMKERFKPGTKPPKGITKGSASRAFKSLIQSPDEVWGDLIEQYLSGKLKSSGGDLSKSLLGTVRSQQQNKVPKAGKVLATDAGHHGNPLYMLDVVAEQDPEVARQFMNLANQEGFEFGDTLRNLDFFDERAHTGNRPKLNIGQQPKPGNLYGEEGLREVSGHPLGTSDKSLKIPKGTYKTGDELFIAAKPSLQRARQDLEMARFADAPRRAEANRLLGEAGLPSVYNQNATPADVKKAQEFFTKNPSAEDAVAAAFKTPNKAAALKHIKTLSILGPMLGTAGLVVDAGGAKAAADVLMDPKATKQDKGQATVDALSSGLGIGSFFNPALAPAAVASGFASLAIDNRRERDKQKEEELKLLAGERSYVGPAETLQIRPSATERAKLTSQLRNRRRGTAFR